MTRNKIRLAVTVADSLAIGTAIATAALGVVGFGAYIAGGGISDPVGGDLVWLGAVSASVGVAAYAAARVIEWGWLR